MLLLLINILVIVVIGAILFYLIDRFVRDGRLANLLKILVGADLPSGDPTTAIAGVRHKSLLGRASSKTRHSDHPPGLWNAAIRGAKTRRDLTRRAILSTRHSYGLPHGHLSRDGHAVVWRRDRTCGSRGFGFCARATRT